MFHLQMMKYTIDEHTFVYICMSTVFVYVPSNLGHREIITCVLNIARCSSLCSLHAADTIKVQAYFPRNNKSTCIKGLDADIYYMKLSLKS